MIRLVHIINGLPMGGAEMTLYKLLSGTDRGRFQLEVISLTDRGVLAPRIEALGIPVQTLGMRRGVPDPVRLLRLAALLRWHKPDVVQTWMYHSDLIGGLAAKLAGIDAVAWNIRHSTLDPVHTKRTTLLTARACAALSRQLPARIVACSEASRQIHIAMGYDGDRMVVIPNGYDLEAFRPDPEARRSVRRELGLSDEAPLIGLVGRFDPQKDHETFVAAAGLLLEENPAVHFVLAGTEVTPDNTTLKSWIDATGRPDHFHLLGRREDIPRLTAAFDLATSSSAYGEAFPNVVGEAMACGVPCVVTDVGDAALIVGDTGVVVPPRSPRALYAAWLSMLEAGPDRRAALGRAARERVASQFSLPGIVARYQALHEELAGHGR